MLFPRLSWLIFATLGALLLGVAACGGSSNDRLSAQEYLQKVQSIAEKTAEDESAAFPSEEASASMSPDERKQATIDGLESVSAILGDAITQVGDLKPPEDLQDAHDALVTEGKNLSQNFSDLAAQAEDVPPDGIEEFFSTQVFSDATFAPFGQACMALQDLGTEQGIQVDLHCSE